MTEMTRERARIGLAVVACLALVGSAAAEPPTAANDVLPLDVRAKAVIEAHCGLCRRGGQTEATASDTIPSLDALADDPGLVLPGRPDASPLYLHMVSGHPPGEDEAAGPSPEEIETVRDWIESLPSREQGCRHRAPISAEAVKESIRLWTEDMGASEAGTRFVSLAHLWNACITPMRLVELRVAAATLLGALTGRREGLQLETLGEESVLLAIRPGEEALAAADWERLTADAPLSAHGSVPADWLAAQILSRPPDADSAPGAIGRTVLDDAGRRAVSALARVWTRDVDLVRAAAERGVTPRALKATLAEVDGELLVPARRLAYGALPRAAWDRLSRALDGGPGDGIERRAGEDASDTIDVVLWPDQPFYRPRDLVTFNARVSKACHLTLIGVDGEGQAIVLFPNELEPENLVAPSVTVKVPGNEAGYQFRVDWAGEETVVAICQRHARRPEGIAYDYERQRFAMLGDWRTFLRTVPQREKEIRAREEAEAARNKRRRRAVVEEPPPVAPDERGTEGRAAITVVIEQGGKAP